MKRMISALAVVAFLFVSVFCYADGRVIPINQLPAAAQTFIKTHFADKTAAYAEKDRDHGIKYEVKFTDGTEIDFNSKGEWDKVDCKYSAVPAALVPAAIATYVQTNFAGALITKIDKEHYGYEIELSTDLELKFDRNGNLMYIDD
ncbi:MAG: PepSY-like domain-containing protein [Bacteroidales bacterium]|nr:PepSY-like domain-containing protein [Bacteroidales bacterium]MBP5692256.1 PepSY-like domain-containing protein [Bacteroidales bacterium]